METIKCPNCGSTDVIAEAEIIVRFRINDNGDVEIVSEWSDIIEDIDKEVVYKRFEYDRAEN